MVIKTIIKERGPFKSILIALLWINFINPSIAQKSVLRFQHYTANQGLSQNMVDCILEDSKGFMWFGTWNGLNRFDGYTFTIFKQNPDERKSLSDNFVYSMCEDHYGNLWIGTANGLNAYLYEEDKFIVFRHQPENDQTIVSNRINAIITDRNGKIWIGTDHGADKIIISGQGNVIEDIQHYRSGNQPDGLSGENVLSVYEDPEGNIWIGTDNGLNLFDIQKNAFTHYLNNPQAPGTLPENTVNTIYRDSSGTLWIGTNFGLSRMDAFSGRFYNYSFNPADPKSLIHNTVMSITEDITGRLIIGTLGGLSIYNKQQNNFDNYKHNLNTFYGLNNDFINCLYCDKNGNIWIGTERGGINTYNIYQKNFEFLEHVPGNKNSLSHSTINSIWEDDQHIWIGTAGGGLNKYDKKSESFEHYYFRADDPYSIASDFITSIHGDQEGNLWFGSWGSGLNKLTPENKKKGKFIHYAQSPGDSTGLINDFISSIIEDQSGNLWIGTLGGLDRFNPASGIFEHVTGTFNQKAVDQVGCLQLDRQHNLWAGTIQGLFMIPAMENGEINPHTNEIHYYVHIPEDSNSISGNYVISICLDKQNDLWFGTYGNGINKLVIDSGSNKSFKFVNYTEKDGLSNNVVYSILEDNSGYLWLSTDNGLSRFDPVQKDFRNYYTSDGLQSNQFYWSACFKNSRGKLYFGSMNGLNAFYPDKINVTKSSPKTIITDFKVFNQSVEVGKPYNGRVIFKKSIFNTEKVVLSYRSREFSIEFSALDFDQPEKIRYAYKMDGFDEHWTSVSANRRFANYTNLKGGDYTFMVKATNEDGLTDPLPYKLQIKIIPPFWATWGFRIAMILLLIGSVIVYNRYRVYTLKLQKKKLEQLVKERTAKIEEQTIELKAQAENLLETNLQLEKRQEQIQGQKHQLEIQNAEILEQRDRLIELNKKVQQINQQQLKFFTHISHEFRTPLTLITTPIEQMIQETHGTNHLKSRLQMVYKNTQRLLHLINQLMEIRKVETGRIELRASKGDIVKFVNNISQSFKTLAIQKDIRYRISAIPDTIEIYFDSDKVENIIYNLLSNAFKYTFEKGNIDVSISVNKGVPDNSKVIPIIEKHHYKHLDIKDYVEIKVSDTGPGIDHNHVKDIFRRFYRIHNPLNFYVKGTGIGLFLVKELVKAHKGLLFVETSEREGSSFSVLLPASENHLAPEEIIIENHADEYLPKNVHVQILSDQFESPAVNLQNNNGYSTVDQNGNALILIIDDDHELLSITRDYLVKTFRIIQATNGLEGLEMARKNQPDLIISDIMMPEMDGLELCNHIKTNIHTSHIPVILLTARSEVDDYIEGFESGADDYIPKPFNIKILEAKSRSLIENRQRLRKLFMQSLVPVPKEMTTTNVDEQFLQRTIKIVEKNINNPEFGVQKLAAEMCVSRSLLHKKLASIVDLSANDFITSMRLKKSALLLMQGNLNISEIAFEVGFNDPKYFSRCFKKHFGLSPTEYVDGVALSQ
jgi:ligand-binding sensor domain-containing protein/signal transduction histidine kinase/DNA-binding response OmpR family regulator